MSEENEEVYLCALVRSHDSDDEDFQLEPETNKRKNKKKSNNDAHIESSHESSEDFIPFQHEYSLHGAHINLSNQELELDVQPYFIFQKFFSNQTMKTIVDNTNIYAYAHGIKLGKSNLAGEGRNWTELTIQELKTWLALVIYMGIFKFPAVEDYWKTDMYYPSHEVTKLMSLFRFQQISYF
jgi:hypothetical protein